MLVLVAFLILIAIIGGKAGLDLVRGLMMVAFGVILLMAGCAIV